MLKITMEDSLVDVSGLISFPLLTYAREECEESCARYAMEDAFTMQDLLPH